MKVTWDDTRGYHRLTEGSFSVVVTDLHKLDDDNIDFICKKLNLKFHFNRERLFADIRKRAMETYISDQVMEYTQVDKNIKKLETHLFPRSRPLSIASKRDIYNPPALPKSQSLLSLNQQSDAPSPLPRRLEKLSNEISHL